MTFEQIGQKLKSAREGQGLSLNQVWERTKIPMPHLLNMEAGLTDDLPETVYVAGFIKRYADMVGLNGQALSDEFRKEVVPDTTGNGNGHFSKSKAPKVGAPQLVMAPAPYKGKTKMDSGASGIAKVIFFPAMCVLMVLTLISVLLKWHSDTNANQLDPSILSLGSTMSQIPATNPNVAPPTATATAPGADPTAQTPSNQNVSIIASKHVWVDVKSLGSGESLFTGFLEAGDRRDFKDAQGIRVHAGNGGSVTVESDGKKELLGANGKISEKTYASANAATGAAPADAASTTASLGTGTTLTTPKPVIKKIVRKPVVRRTVVAPVATDSGSHGSVDVPYRYTEGNTDQ